MTESNSAAAGRFFHLYQDECIELLRQAVAAAASVVEQQQTLPFSRPLSSKSRYDSFDDNNNHTDSSPSEGENENKQESESSSSEHGYSSSSSSSSSSAAEEEEAEDAINVESSNQVADEQLAPQVVVQDTINNNNNNKAMAVSSAEAAVVAPKKNKPPHNKKTKQKQRMDERQRSLTLRKHFASLSCVSMPVAGGSDNNNNNNNTTAATATIATSANVLAIPSCLLSKKDRHYHHYHHSASTKRTPAAASTMMMTMAHTLLDLAVALQTRPVIVLSLRSGRFAGAVFLKEKCVTHTTFQRYTVRKGQGKAQSAQDGQGRRPKSVGSQLRRAGEVALQQDITQTLQEWKQQHYIASAALIFLAVPKTMLKTVWEAAVIEKDDKRIRKVPLDMGRPTFENVGLMHAVLMTVQQRREEILSCSREQEGEENEQRQGIRGDLASSEHGKRTETKETPVVAVKPEFPKPSELHVAARNGNVESLQSMLANINDNNNIDKIDFVNQPAGPDFMTPLHFAAQSTAAAEHHAVDFALNAAECVRLLLLQGHADPCLVDARNRPPYFLASHEKVRDAFRMARANLGEDYCAWDDGAKVGPPLTTDDIQAKKDKDAEKRRRKKARQKEKKQKEKAQVEEAERLKREEEERQRQEEEAKRVRDGLAPKVKTSSGAVCDFCQTVCKGRQRSQMFKRLEYSYCSTDCVQKHKRELMAAAAQKRFGGS